ncbi:MAG: M50 family metallopeptidase [Clostridia bacterium]|nr:M50 family metallopeptidase [Clostridia bacterium]
MHPVTERVLRPVKAGKVEIQLLTILLFAISLFFDFFEMLLAAYCITALHECAHVLVAKMCKVPIDGVEVLPFGITMRVRDECIVKPYDEIKISLAGPVCNFLTAFFTYGLWWGVYRDYIITSSMAMGIFNLLPALPLDGGRILRAVLVKRLGHIRATTVAFKVTRVTALLIAIAGLYIVYATGFNFSFLLIGVFLLANLTEERKRANTIIMKDILYSRKKLASQGALRADILVADVNEKAFSVIENLSYDRYYMVNVINSSMDVLKVVTETEIIEKTATYGMNTTLKKIVGI